MPKFEQMPGGETPVAEKPEETILEKMRGRAKKLYLALGFLSAFSGAGMSREAMAEEVRKKPDVASKINLDSIRRADLPEGKGEVLFAQTDEKEIALDGKTGKRQATMIEVTDEGDPKVKGDELKIKGFLYKFKAKNETIWDTKISAEGRLRFFENPLGKFDPTKRKASLGISMDRDIFNSDLLQIWYMKRLAEGMKYVGKDNIEEAEKLKKELEREYLQMKERFPNQKLNENEIIRVLGRKPKKPEAPKQTQQEKEWDIPPALTSKDFPK